MAGLAPLPEGRRRRRGGRALTSALRPGPLGPLAATLLAGALLSSACSTDEAPGPSGLSDSVYVEVMARLVLLDPDMTSETDVPLRGLPRDSARSLVLDRWGVEPERLLRFAEQQGRSPARMAELWRRIQERSDTLESRGWRPGEENDGEARPDNSSPGDSVPGDSVSGDSATSGRAP